MSCKADNTQGNYVASDTATLLFVRAPHGILNATFYKLLENRQPIYFQATCHALLPCRACTNNNVAMSSATKVASCMVGLTDMFLQLLGAVNNKRDMFLLFTMPHCPKTSTNESYCTIWPDYKQKCKNWGVTSWYHWTAPDLCMLLAFLTALELQTLALKAKQHDFVQKIYDNSS